MEGTLGTIFLWAGTRIPRGWMACQGQQLEISQYTALFSVIGTTYGGDGRVMFQLPDLRGRLALGAGDGPGLYPWGLGQRGGTETVTLSEDEMPAHSHDIDSEDLIIRQPAYDSNGSDTSPDGNVPAVVTTGAGPTQSEAKAYAPHANALLAQCVISGTPATASTGGSQPFPVMQPSLALNFIICVEGLYPTFD